MNRPARQRRCRAAPTMRWRSHEPDEAIWTRWISLAAARCWPAPDCGGVMWELDEGDLSRFRCHVGHTYTAEVMSLALDDNLRRALASAVRALEERTTLARKLHHQAKNSGHRLLAETWAAKMNEFERESEIIRNSTRRMDRLAAHADLDKQSAAE